MADHKLPNDDRVQAARRPGKRTPFFEAIARAELGRAYWSEGDEAELRDARTRKRKPEGARKPRR